MAGKPAFLEQGMFWRDDAGEPSSSSDVLLLFLRFSGFFIRQEDSEVCWERSRSGWNRADPFPEAEQLLGRIRAKTAGKI